MDIPRIGESEARAMIEQLAAMLDPVALYTHVMEESKFGKTERAGDGWHWTKDFMRKYADPANTEAVIALFERAGLTDDHLAARWLLTVDEWIP